MQAHWIANTLSLFEKYKNKIEVIPNGIEIKNNLPQWHSRNKSGTDDSLNLIYAGGIDQTRGVDILIDVFNKACNKDINVKLTLIGEKDDIISTH